MRKKSRADTPGWFELKGQTPVAPLASIRPGIMREGARLGLVEVRSQGFTNALLRCLVLRIKYVAAIGLGRLEICRRHRVKRAVRTCEMPSRRPSRYLGESVHLKRLSGYDVGGGGINLKKIRPGTLYITFVGSLFSTKQIVAKNLFFSKAC